MIASSLLRGLVSRPGLWPEALRAWVAFTPRTWWAQRPFLPLPRRAYLRWRIQTAYGSTNTRPEVTDLVEFLEWRREQR